MPNYIRKLDVNTMKRICLNASAERPCAVTWFTARIFAFFPQLTNTISIGRRQQQQSARASTDTVRRIMVDVDCIEISLISFLFKCFGLNFSVGLALFVWSIPISIKRYMEMKYSYRTGTLTPVRAKFDL